MQIIHLRISTLFLGYPTKPISPPLGHFRPVSKGSFDIVGGRIHYRLFEGDLVGFLTDEIRWIRVTHRSKKIDIGSNSWWNQDFIPHFLEIGWSKFKEKKIQGSGRHSENGKLGRHTSGTWTLVAIKDEVDLSLTKNAWITAWYNRGFARVWGLGDDGIGY